MTYGPATEYLARALDDARREDIERLQDRRRAGPPPNGLRRRAGLVLMRWGERLAGTLETSRPARAPHADRC